MTNELRSELCEDRINHINDKFYNWLSKGFNLDDYVEYDNTFNEYGEYSYKSVEDTFEFDLEAMIEDFQETCKVRILDFKENENYDDLLELLNSTVVSSKLGRFEP